MSSTPLFIGSPISNPNPNFHEHNDDHSQRFFLLGVAAMASFLAFIAIMTVLAYFVGRRRGLAGVIVGRADEVQLEVEKGLDEETLGALPKLLFSKAGPKNEACSVCLAEYGESEWIRVLPDCGHVFHLKCVDSWLRLHPTCPLCRKLPASCDQTSN